MTGRKYLGAQGNQSSMNRGKKVMPEIFFVIRIEEERFYFSRSAVYSEEEVQAIEVKNIVNETGLRLKTGDKIIANLQIIKGAPHIVIKKIIASQQPMAISDRRYLKSLRIYIVDKEHLLDFQEINRILEGTLGITVYPVEEPPKDYHLVINLSGEDPGTKKYQCVFSLFPMSYPLNIDFPRVSVETKKYLQMVYPEGKITDSSIFAFRMIHFLLHKLNYPDHFDVQKIEEYKKLRKAREEGDPSQISVPDLANICLCDWELIHFLAVQPDLALRSFEKMLCDQCIKIRKGIPVGVGLKDLEMASCTLNEFSKPYRHFRTEKYIFYVIESRKDGLILNEAPYKSKITVNIAERDWIETMFETYEDLCNIFVPTELFNKRFEMRKGEKALVQVEIETTTTKKDEFGFMRKARLFKVENILKKDVKIINPSNLLSRITPFRLDVVLKIGPGVDLNFINKVAKIVNRLTGWRVRIDRSSFEVLEKSSRRLTDLYEEWEKVDSSGKSGLVARVNEIVNGLSPKIYEVEDSFKVFVYVFPEKCTFIKDVFGDVAFGKALNRIFAVVSIFPSMQPEYEKLESCKNCQEKLVNPFREEMTSLFVIHEVLHIASGLDDHPDCSLCVYGRKQMLPFRRFYCEECIRKGNNKTQPNCLMSYACPQCIASGLSGKNSLSQILCKKCREKLLPADQFTARQAARMNSLIYLPL